MSAWGGPLFVVGPSRSGTAMLRSILNNHSEIGLADETHYFDDLRTRPGITGGASLGDEQLRRCADYFRAADHRPYGMGGVPEQSRFSRSDLLDPLGDQSRTADDVFESYLRRFAEAHGKWIWGEKTPRHVFRIEDILRFDDEAKVICMIRDPRAVVASYRDWKHQGGLNVEGDRAFEEAIRRDEERAGLSYNLVIASLTWRSVANTARRMDRAHPSRVLVVRYEDVIADQEAVVREVCGFVGVGYEAGMLDVPHHNSSFVRFDRDAGITSVSEERWRRALSSSEIAVVQRLCASAMREHGYVPEETGHGVGALGRELVKVPLATARALQANRERIPDIGRYLARRIRYLVR